ncbi:hypothetical protein Peur_019671 [Populus x canadensis]
MAVNIVRCTSSLINLELQLPKKQELLISWCFPARGVNKVNTNGSLIYATGLATVGELIRDDAGLEVDSKIAADMINADNEPTGPNSQLIHSIIFLLQWPWRVRFLRCADWLANSAQLHILLSWVFIIFQRLFLII